MKKLFRIALAGNPNCGKTSIFNCLTGARQHVGNYPGVTVESKSGKFSIGNIQIELIDLPGIYSLSSISPEEAVAFDELTSGNIDLIINVIDSSAPNRSLYLTTQLAELGIPMVVAFNMSDDALKKGIKFEIPKLEKYFALPIVQTVGRNYGGIKPLIEKISQMLSVRNPRAVQTLSYGKDLDESIEAIAGKIKALNIERFTHIPPRFFAIKLLESDTCTMKIPELQPVWKEVSRQIKHLSAIHAIDDTPTFMADKRYAIIAGACRGAISFPAQKRRDISDAIDTVVTNKFLGLPIFFAIMYATFWFTFTCADPVMGWIEEAFAALGDGIKSAWGSGTLPYIRDLLTDGIIGGVGGVVVFLPNILFMFLALALLEESGYMARAAFIMDGVMRRFGLQGKSFVPLILGFGCSVPAIMATRSIESERDRKTTIMVLPLMSCSARLPIYSLIIPAFFAEKYQALTMWAIYILGIAVALLAALALKKTVFKGEGEVYLMELPPYRFPTLKSLLLHMWDKGKVYLRKAGTIILATSIILYACNTFPEKTEFSKDYDTLISKDISAAKISEDQIKILEVGGALGAADIAEIEENSYIMPESLIEVLYDKNLTAEQKNIVDTAAKANASIAALQNEKSAELLEYTISGRIGKFFEPVFEPIGFDWKLTTATIGALAAKEVFVSQLGILYSEGESDEESQTLREKLAETYTPLQAFCIMVFCLLSIPCLATLAIIKRELNSWKAPILEAAMLFSIAYILTFIIYQAGTLLGIGTKILG